MLSRVTSFVRVSFMLENLSLLVESIISAGMELSIAISEHTVPERSFCISMISKHCGKSVRKFSEIETAFPVVLSRSLIDELSV